MDRLRKDLRASTAEGTATNVMVGIGETYLPAFVLALSGSHIACGLISTVPLMIGALLQLVSPTMVRRWGSCRRWVVCTAAVQAVAFVPLVAAAMLGHMPLTLVFLSAAFYWGAGMASGGAWNAWMETLVPERLRARYFARRTLISQWGVLAGFIAGGVTLQAASGDNWHLEAFALLFLVAAGTRLLSSCLLARQSERHPPLCVTMGPPARKMLDLPSGGADKRVLLYLLATQMAVQIAAPYFNPYMLGHLEFSYSAYMVVTCTAALAKILCLRAVGRVVDRWGSQRTLWTAGLATMLLPALWIISSSLPYLLGVQVLSGVAWAACDLAALLLLFKTIPPDNRVQVLALFNLANAAATVAGSMIGGLILSAFHANQAAYLMVFAASTVARIGALFLLAGARHAATGRQPARIPQVVRTSAAVAMSWRENYPQGPHWSRPVPTRSVARGEVAGHEEMGRTGHDRRSEYDTQPQPIAQPRCSGGVDGIEKAGGGTSEMGMGRNP